MMRNPSALVDDTAGRFICSRSAARTLSSEEFLAISKKDFLDLICIDYVISDFFVPV